MYNNGILNRIKNNILKLQIDKWGCYNYNVYNYKISIRKFSQEKLINKNDEFTIHIFDMPSNVFKTLTCLNKEYNNLFSNYNISLTNANPLISIDELSKIIYCMYDIKKYRKLKSFI